MGLTPQKTMSPSLRVSAGTTSSGWPELDGTTTLWLLLTLRLASLVRSSTTSCISAGCPRHLGHGGWPRRCQSPAAMAPLRKAWRTPARSVRTELLPTLSEGNELRAMSPSNLSSYVTVNAQSCQNTFWRAARFCDTKTPPRLCQRRSAPYRPA